jgi:hypothetical protein
MQGTDQQAYVATSIVTEDHAKFTTRVSDTGIVAIHLDDYPVSFTMHVTRKSLKSLLDACLDLQMALAEKERAACQN